MGVINKNGLQHIATHKYVSGTCTPVDLFLDPFWLWCTELLPTWLAPNLVTLIGLCHLILGYLLMCYWSPTMGEPVPSWLLVFGAMLLWCYTTLDCMDGKQARRTNTCSPLGGLFDHGCDALGLLYQTTIVYAVLSPGSGYLALFGVLISHFGFFCAQWQEYHTHKLATAIGSLGVTEIQHSIMSLALTGAWHGELGSVSVFGIMSLRTLLFFSWFIFVLVVCAHLIKSTLARAFKDGGEAQQTAGILQLVPVVVLSFGAFLWPENLLASHGRLFCATCSLLMVHLTHQIIVMSMAKQVFPWQQPLVLLYCVAGVFARYLAISTQAWLLRLVLVIVVATSMSWLNVVCKQCCAKLNIQVFHIPDGADYIAKTKAASKKAN